MLHGDKFHYHKDAVTGENNTHLDIIGELYAS